MRRRQEHAARRADAGRRDPRAAAGEPVRRHAAAAARLGAARSKRSCSCCSVRCSSSPRRAGSRATPRCSRSACVGVAARVGLSRVSRPAAAVRRGDAGAVPAAPLRHAARADAGGGEPAEALARAHRAGAARARAPASPASSMRRSGSRWRRCRAPTSCATMPRVDLAATMIPAREVGGDLYDFFRLDDRRLFFLVGDVAGKGLSASIFMAVSKALYKSTMLRAPGADIGALMTAANAEVSRDNPEMLFVTAFAGDPRPRDRRARVLQRRARRSVPRASATTPRCAASRTATGRRCARSTTSTTGERAARCGPASWLCVVTDGVTEAQNASGRAVRRGARAERAAGPRARTRATPAPSSTRCARTWKRLPPAPNRRTTSRCSCCAGTGRARRAPVPG